ncbi:hypothetical protein NU195Hw_g8782t1 [Hortaea werneckii]
MAMSVHQEGYLPLDAQVIRYRVACVPNENDEDESTQHSANHWFFYAIVFNNGDALQAVRFDLRGRNSDTGTGCYLHQKAFGFPLTDKFIVYRDIPAAGGACLMSFIADLEWSGLLKFRFQCQRGRRHWILTVFSTLFPKKHFSCDSDLIARLRDLMEQLYPDGSRIAKEPVRAGLFDLTDQGLGLPWSMREERG